LFCCVMTTHDGVFCLGQKAASEDEEEYGDNQQKELALEASSSIYSLKEPLLLKCNPNDSEIGGKEAGEANNENVQNDSNNTQSKNIPLILTYTFIIFAGRSMWSQSVLSAMVYLLRNNNPESVGFLTSIMGVSQLVASLPSGVLADMHRRDYMLKVGSLVGTTAFVVTVYASFSEIFGALGVSLALWGVFYGITNTSISALFADSISEGERSYYFTQRMMLTKLGCTAGPTASLVMFAILGDDWTMKDCAIVMTFGQVICLFGILILCFLRDEYIVEHNESMALEVERTEAIVSITEENEVQQSCDHDTEPRESQKSLLCLPQHRAVPVLTVISDVLAGCAAGMSTRYYTIFFIDNLQLSPSIVSLLYILSPLGQMVMHKIAYISGRKVGRCQIVVIFKWIGTSFMICMILAYKHHLHVSIVCILYLLRTSFANATSNLTKSIIMDSVPRNERGKWSALESVNMFSWSGSAALGGLLVSSKGILFIFYVTAALQLVATLPLIVLFERVKD